VVSVREEAVAREVVWRQNVTKLECVRQRVMWKRSWQSWRVRGMFLRKVSVRIVG